MTSPEDPNAPHGSGEQPPGQPGTRPEDQPGWAAPLPQVQQGWGTPPSPEAQPGDTRMYMSANCSLSPNDAARR